MTTAALPIADVRYLWSEVERLKSHVHHLQQSERHALDEQQRLRDYVGSFITQAQLDAALCTKISQSSVSSSIDRLRGELLDQLDKKADMDILQSLQSKKLDISVYESSTWDLKKFRTALEQNVRDLFAQFAHQIESQVNDKLSIDDFDRIFNPEANGQKAAIETAAARIARMNEQLESLQEYVHSDRQRQHKVADLSVSLLDLTRKHNASRNSIAQLFSSFENAKERSHAIDEECKRVATGFAGVVTEMGDFQSKIQSDTARQHQEVTKMRDQVDQLSRTNQQLTQTLQQIQKFTQHTLLNGVDTKLRHMKETIESALGEAHHDHQKFRSQTSQQLGKISEKMQQTLEYHGVMETRLRRVETIVSDVRDELLAVKGPLLTVARNLREENVAIQAEIRRSQDESRDILIDYKGLLEKDVAGAAGGGVALVAALPPSRPASSAAAAASRKHRQQQISTLTARIDDGQHSRNNNNTADASRYSSGARPHTSHGRLGGSPASRLRARTAGAIIPPPPTTTSTSGIINHTESQAARREVTRVVSEPTTTAERPKSEAGPRPKKMSLLYTIAGTSGATESSTAPAASLQAQGSSGSGSGPEAEETDELFVFPRATSLQQIAS